MHHCEEFRERITEHIIDRRDLSEHAELRSELMLCEDCSDFYSESCEVIEVMSSVHFDIPEEQWNGIAERLEAALVADQARNTSVRWLPALKTSIRNVRPYIPATAGLAAMLLITLAIYNLPLPLDNQPPVNAPVQQVVVDYYLPLDPVTVEYIEQSELLLRSVMKLGPDTSEDLEDAKQAASRQLVGLEQRRQAAADVLPVVTAMDRYEMILRDIRNIQGATAADDIQDIQNRIERNGLIASMKSFQPRLTLVEFTDHANQ